MRHRRTALGITVGLAALVVPALAVPVLVGVLVLLVPGQAPAVEASADDAADDARAVALLQESATAPDRVSYTGTRYVSSWSSLTASSASASAVVLVQHSAGGPTEYAVRGEREVIPADVDAQWLAGDAQPADLMTRAYDVTLVGLGEVAGRTAHVIEAHRRDGSVAARLWLDAESALTLRRETFTGTGSLLNASAFIDVTLTGAPCCGETGPRLADESQDRNVAAGTTPSGGSLQWADIEALRATGWICPGQLAGGLALYQARQVGDAIQLSYSDGVMSVSMFQQAGTLDPGRLDAYAMREVAGGAVYSDPGPPARFTWATGKHVITVVSEAPQEVVEALVRAVPPEQLSRPAADDGVLARIARGAKRVGSWLNPFD